MPSREQGVHRSVRPFLDFESPTFSVAVGLIIAAGRMLIFASGRFRVDCRPLGIQFDGLSAFRPCDRDLAEFSKMMDWAFFIQVKQILS